MNFLNNFKKYFWLFSIPRLHLIKIINHLKENGIKLRQKHAKIKTSRVKSVININLKGKNVKSASPQKMENGWLIFISKKTYR